ncbi:uncharacterized protein LOC122249696 isoform X2 [Penaeus japonicus]|uniref:uncharacterized protein LOC122249696 isoform X2 n=1 Tax=Penaeus japonicus TaxID=27405 RepID=UPI001C7145D3|nr:uncharacterized protein LOC122249696 isoform X2 [Penaeus japonicus]
MPPYKPFLSLTNLCIEWVVEWLAKNVRRLGAPKERLKQREYIAVNLNANIKQMLLNIIFQQHMYKWDLASKCLMMELLGDRSTRIIDFTKGGYGYVDEVWHFYRTLTIGLMINLTKIGVTCNFKTESDKKYLTDINHTFYRVFSQMKNLRWVILKGVADTVLLGMMGTNCPYLEYLDVTGSHKVNDESVANLILKDPLLVEGRNLQKLTLQDIPTQPCANSLKYVCLSETDVSLVSAVILLHYVSKLESFGGDIHAGSVSSVMEVLQPTKSQMTFQLHELWDAKILPHHASLMNMMCPHLTHLNTDASSLDCLHIFSSISSLTLSLYYRNFGNEIYNYLLGSGENLKKLILIDHINCSLDISWLVDLTPNLEHIEATVDMQEGTEMSEWLHLKFARLTVGSSKVLLALLTSTPELRDLDITFVREPYQETFECINDDLIIYALIEDGLKKLQKLKISECAIGLKGIDCLLLHCPDLTYLAPLAFWHGLCSQDLHSLVQRIKENNWQLKLIMRTDWENGQELQKI